MKRITYPTCVIFGGTGFIGSHLAHHFITKGLSERVVLADVMPYRPNLFREHRLPQNVTTVKADVRQPLISPELPAKCDLVINLAAVHREPGHESREYFETNIFGAEHVCDYAERAGCKRIVFTSSISTYGPSEDPKTETSLPTPTSPYGASKLVAEKIHIAWQHADSGRRLLIVRPGVVFGPGELGNVTRMVRAVLKNYFVFMSNKEKVKAGGYVKELCYTVDWALERLENQDEKITLYNFASDPNPSIYDFVATIQRVGGKSHKVRNVPFWVILMISYLIDLVAKPFRFRHPFSPVRVRKLIRSNYILPQFLKEAGYKQRYSLKEALEDWKRECPEDWQW